MGVLAIDLSATAIPDPNGAVVRLQALGKVEFDLAWRALECTFNRRLRPLKPTVPEREADTEHRGHKREDESPRACREFRQRDERRLGDTCSRLVERDDLACRQPEQIKNSSSSGAAAGD